MKAVTIRQVVLGEGRPKICVPIVGTDEAAILAEGERIAAIAGRGADLCEWRVDWYNAVFDPAQLAATARALRAVLGELPLLATYRTAGEGGARPCSQEAYTALVRTLCKIPEIDLVDIELMTGDAAVRAMIAAAHAGGKTAILSNHDFHATPAEDELVARLARMEALGADVCKIAVMPQTAADVVTLLAATVRRRSETAVPLITMSMGALGAVSRVSGALTGSCLTFGSMTQASAPGQIPAAELLAVLKALGGTE